MVFSSIFTTRLQIPWDLRPHLFFLLGFLHNHYCNRDGFPHPSSQSVFALNMSFLQAPWDKVCTAENKEEKAGDWVCFLQFTTNNLALYLDMSSQLWPKFWRGEEGDKFRNHAAHVMPTWRSLSEFWLLENLMLLADWILLLRVHVNIPRPKVQNKYTSAAKRHSLSNESGDRLVTPECPVKGDSLRLCRHRMTARAPQSLVGEQREALGVGWEEKRRSPVLTWSENQGERGNC